MSANAHFSTDHRISPAITVTNGAAGTSAINGATLDMSGFEKLAVVLTTGPIVATATTSMKLEQSANSDMSAAEDVLGSGQTIADSDDDKIFVIDSVRPTKRYVRLVVTRGVAAATVVATYIQHGPRNVPVTQPAGVTVETFKDAAGGAA